LHAIETSGIKYSRIMVRISAWDMIFICYVVRVQMSGTLTTL